MQGLFSRFPYSANKVCRWPLSHAKATAARAKMLKRQQENVKY